MPMDLTAGKLFIDNYGSQTIDLLLHNKYTLGFDILAVQEEAIEITKFTGNAQAGQSDQKLNKSIQVKKEAFAKLDKAPEKFFQE